MVALKSTAMVGGIIKVMLILQVSSNAFADNKHTVSSNNDKTASGWHLVYYTFTEARNWTDSQSSCEASETKLVTLRSEAEKNALIEHIITYEQRNVAYWIHTCTNESGLVCQRDCTEVSVNNQSLIEIHPRSTAPCSKRNLFICQEEEADPK